MTEKMTSKKLSRREMLRLTAITGAGLAAAACAPAATPAPAAPPTAAPAAQPTEAPAAPTAAPAAAAAKLRLVVMDYDEKMKPDTQTLVDAWNSQGKSQVELNVYSWNDGPQKLTTEISAGQAPDLANNNSQWIGQWDSINEVQPLDTVLPKEFLAAFVPSGLKAFTVKNRLIALPYFLDPRGMYYRKDLFDAQSLKAPTTWDDVKAAGGKLHKPPDITGYGMTFSRTSDDLDYWWYAWFGANGADNNVSVWTPEGKSRWSDPLAIEATQFLADMNKYANADIGTGGRDDSLQPLFYAGKLAMLETGSWFPTLLKNNAPNLAYDLVTIPTKTADLKPITGFWPDAVAMFTQSKNKEAAGEFLQYMFNFDNRLAFAKQRGVIPERTDVGASPQYAVSDVEKFFVDQLKTAWNVYEAPFPATFVQTNTNAESEILKAVLGEQSAEQAMKNAAAFADKTNGLA